MDRSTLTIFTNPNFGEIRTAIINNEPWFVGKDVATALGYSNGRKAIADHVDEEDKGVTKRDTPGGMQDLTIINESGLYSLILSSKLPAAKDFKRWVTSEVLPSIRKHGAYMTPETIEEIISNPDTVIKLATQLKEERKKNKSLEAENAALRPKAEFHDRALDSTNLMNATELASSLGLKSAQELNKWLGVLGVIKKVRHNGQYVLTAKYSKKGYALSLPYRYNGTVVYNQLCFTQRGRKMIYELFVKIGLIDPQLVPPVALPEATYQGEPSSVEVCC